MQLGRRSMACAGVHHAHWLVGEGLFDHHLTHALAAATGGFGFFLAAPNRRFHVVAASLEFTQDALVGHLSLEVLDRTLESALTDDDLDGLALDRFT